MMGSRREPYTCTRVQIVGWGEAKVCGGSLVVHRGESAAGESVYTLVLTDYVHDNRPSSCNRWFDPRYGLEQSIEVLTPRFRNLC